ncbi:adenosylcobinamide-phosphate synthase CbiB [Dichotomicrobium thermohalophilum]|uniref:Cobalamin biosynthesis protein CobD n=1 Tax=Dichotomicrobium thermohalophilum TaxID=933063 RepID=A0A397PH59_9HYPH|nr:adenosylcobinamide-phosphate synthase CbiB [Dichotomicrobium thermohalophilum]RIA45464.1 adenosylcobinamide-phosphate synthase [Dichotomicrobium thermohalophilum]
MTMAGAMIVALALDALVGWPDRLYARIGHPVTWLGALIDALDARFNREDRDARSRRLAGAGVTFGITALAILIGAVLQALAPEGGASVLLVGVLAWPLVAARSMYDHVTDVARPLAADDIDGARQAVSMIVGRDPNQLDSAGIRRSTLESLAENTSDGIVAPLFYGVVFGLPGIMTYKAINTLDSMIGHRNGRHEDFGGTAARLDDVVNLIPARLTGLIFALISRQPWTALQVMWRDAANHRSPNAGWPEAALAGALGVRLSGPRIYGDRVADEPWLNSGADDPTDGDLTEGLGLFRRAMFAVAGLLAVLALI